MQQCPLLHKVGSSLRFQRHGEYVSNFFDLMQAVKFCKLC